jgi:MFS transporter, putative metabolite:H+ symporter
MGENTMLDALDAAEGFSWHQWQMIAAATFAMLLDYLDYFLVGFVLTYIIGPWHLNLWQSSTILLSSGLGGVIGAPFFGWLADGGAGRRKVFLLTIGVFTASTAALVVTPENSSYGWIYLTAFRFLIGFGAGGLTCVLVPLVQELVPTRKRGVISGLVTSSVPIGFLVGAILVATLAPIIGWRGLTAICVLFGLIPLLIRGWVPESPHWLIRQGRLAEARESIAWAIDVPVASIPYDDSGVVEKQVNLKDLFGYPKRVASTWLINLGSQTGYYGITLWTPVLLVQFLSVRPERAAFYMMFVTMAAFAGRIVLSMLSESIGRRVTGMLCSLGAVSFLLIVAWVGDALLGATVLLLALLMATYFFGEGCFAVVLPYSAEVWPSNLRTLGMGSAYGFGGIGKIIGPMGLALIGSGSSLPRAAAGIHIQSVFFYFASWYGLCGLAYLFLGVETKGQSIEAISKNLDEGTASDHSAPARSPTPLR